MNNQTIADIDITGKRVLIRADLNVPLEKGKVSDDTRIVAALPTIRYVLAYNATPIVCSHLGRPKGKPDAKYSLKPVAERLAQLSAVAGCRWLPTALDQRLSEWLRRYRAAMFCSWRIFDFMRRKKPMIRSLRKHWLRWQTFTLTTRSVQLIARTLRQLVSRHIFPQSPGS